jgi:hypothetical protein
MQLATLFEAAHLAKPKYNLKESQCYWYAGVIWKCVDELFPGRSVAQTTQGKKATYLGFKIGDELATGPVLDEYQVLLSRYDLVRNQEVEMVATAVCISVNSISQD